MEQETPKTVGHVPETENKIRITKALLEID